MGTREHLRYERERLSKKQPVLDAHRYDGVTWSSFRAKLRTWRQQQAKLMESVAFISADDEFEDEESEDLGVQSQDVVLGLPSCFSRDEREAYLLTGFEEIELLLRVGTAFDLLSAIRIAVQHRAGYIQEKDKHGRGQKNAAAGEIQVQQAKELAELLAGRYNANFAKIEDLRGATYSANQDPSPASRLRKIDLKVDLRLAGMRGALNQGESKEEPSWIWGAFTAQEGIKTRGKASEEIGTDSREWDQLRFQTKADLWDVQWTLNSGCELGLRNAAATKLPAKSVRSFAERPRGCTLWPRSGVSTLTRVRRDDAQKRTNRRTCGLGWQRA